MTPLSKRALDAEWSWNLNPETPLRVLERLEQEYVTDPAAVGRITAEIVEWRKIASDTSAERASYLLPEQRAEIETLHAEVVRTWPHPPTESRILQGGLVIRFPGTSSPTKVVRLTSIGFIEGLPRVVRVRIHQEPPTLTASICRWFKERCSQLLLPEFPDLPQQRTAAIGQADIRGQQSVSPSTPSTTVGQE